jgi:hypothetical protein
MSTIQQGNFVHVVATVNLKLGEGQIRYVNPSSNTLRTEATREAAVELVAEDAAGTVLHRETVVLRRSSCEGGSQGDVGLVQADLPYQAGMKAVALVINGKEVSRYQAGELPAIAVAATLGLQATAGQAPHHRWLTLHEATGLAPVAGITYSVQVKPDVGNAWNTIAVGRPTPVIDIDRNQFAGATKAEVRVLRTTGFDEEVIAQETVNLF